MVKGNWVYDRFVGEPPQKVVQFKWNPFEEVAMQGLIEVKLPTPVPDAWMQLLEQYAAAGVTAWIAGGALRDLYHGREVKDVDVWVPEQPDPSQKLAVLHAKWEATSLVEFSQGGNIEEDVNVSRGFTVPGVEHPVNEMVIRKGYLPAVLDSFDFGICQIGMGLDGRVWATPAFVMDSASRTFTYVDKDRPMTNSQARWFRLAGSSTAKYKGWTLEAPWTSQGEAFDTVGG